MSESKCQELALKSQELAKLCRKVTAMCQEVVALCQKLLAMKNQESAPNSQDLASMCQDSAPNREEMESESQKLAIMSQEASPSETNQPTLQPTQGLVEKWTLTKRKRGNNLPATSDGSAPPPKIWLAEEKQMAFMESNSDNPKTQGLVEEWTSTKRKRGNSLPKTTDADAAPPKIWLSEEEQMALIRSNSNNPIQPEPILPFSGKECYWLWTEEDTTDWFRQVLVKGGYEAFGRCNGEILRMVIYDQECQEKTGLGEAFWTMIKGHLDKVYSYT